MPKLNKADVYKLYSDEDLYNAMDTVRKTFTNEQLRRFAKLMDKNIWYQINNIWVILRLNAEKIELKS